MKSALGQKAKWANPRGPKFLRDVINQLFDAINLCGPLEGLGITIEQTASGRTISTLNTPGGKSGAAGAAAANDPDISFFVSDASVTEGDPPETSNKIQVNPGKINDDFPTGLSFAEPYIIDIAEPDGSFLLVLMTYDPDTWSGGSDGVLSRDLEVIGPGDDYPEEGITDGVGLKIQQLAFMYFDSDGDWRIHMTYVGDVDFSADNANSNVIATEFVTVSNVVTSGDDEVLYSHEIGAGRLKTDGDCIRAVYGLGVADGTLLSIRFGDGGDLGDLEIFRIQSIPIESGPGVARIEVLLMRVNSTTYRATIAGTASDGDDPAGLVHNSVSPDIGSGDNFEDNLIISLWCGIMGDAGTVQAHMALIEYIPA